MKFDPKKPYGLICGEHNGALYVQGGVEYDAEYNPIAAPASTDPTATVEPVVKTKAKSEKAPEPAAPMSMAGVEDQLAKQISA